MVIGMIIGEPSALSDSFCVAGLSLFCCVPAGGRGFRVCAPSPPNPTINAVSANTLRRIARNSRLIFASHLRLLKLQGQGCEFQMRQRSSCVLRSTEHGQWLQRHTVRRREHDPKAFRMETIRWMNKLSSSGKAPVMFRSYRHCWSSCHNEHADF